MATLVLRAGVNGRAVPMETAETSVLNTHKAGGVACMQ